MGDRTVPYVEGECDVCGYEGPVLDVYGDYICVRCIDAADARERTDSDPAAEEKDDG